MSLILAVAMLAVGALMGGSALAQAPGPPPSVPPYPVPGGGCANNVTLGSGANTFTGTPVKDCVRLGAGNDTANVAGDPGSQDVVNCGPGRDRVTADSDDKVRINPRFPNRRCEVVIRR
jgi:hypothetical protein